MPRGYKTTCPQCDGHNLYITPDNGLEHCFNCGYSKGVRKDNPEQLLKVSDQLDEIRFYYTRLADYYHACITKEVRDFFYSRGLNDQTIVANRLGYCPPGPHALYQDPVAREAGIAGSQSTSVLAGRAIFPYNSPRRQVVDLRGRSLDPAEELRYKGPYGRAHYRGADEYPYIPAHPPIEKTSDPVVITEGEIKALLCTQEGVPAMALPGINSWKWRLRGCYPGLTRVIIFDSQADRAVAENVYSAVDTLAMRMGECNVLFLPLSGAKMDVDTFILTKGIDTFKLLLKHSLPYANWAILMRRFGHVPR